MICLYLWDNSLGGRAVFQTVLLPVSKSSINISVPRNVGSIMLMNVGFGVTGRYSDFGGRLSLP